MARARTTSLLLLLCCTMPLTVHAVPTTFINNEAGFMAALSGPATTYDFERASGFPADTNGAALGGAVSIGPLFGVNFAASVIQSTSATSGVQAMSTADAGGCCFGTASVDFSGLPTLPSGVGFWGLDLADVGGVEIIRATVSFTNGGNQVYDITLGGAPNFTPIHFGVVDPSDTITSIAFIGTDDGGGNRAWLIDDLTHDGAIPEPASLVPLMLAAAGIYLWRHRA